MGDVVKGAKLYLGRRAVVGTALLETKEIVFRGEVCLVIPKRTIRNTLRTTARTRTHSERGARRRPMTR